VVSALGEARGKRRRCPLKDPHVRHISAPTHIVCPTLGPDWKATLAELAK